MNATERFQVVLELSCGNRDAKAHEKRRREKNKVKHVHTDEGETGNEHAKLQIDCFESEI